MKIPSHARASQVLAVLLLFTIAAVWHFRHAVGEDLSSSYVGCRVLASGNADHLYAHDPVVFSIVRDPVWDTIAERANFAPLGLLHPYIQTPLWAYSLEPLCTRTNFPTFCRLFLVLIMVCTSATLWLVTRYWVPALFHPVWMLMFCLGLAVTDPFRYALFLTQTHMIYICLTVLALILAQKGRWAWAGLALALAAAVKITPAFLVLYWLFSRRYKEALSFVACSVALIALTVLTTGPSLFAAYLHDLSEVSKILLVAFNNQSLAAWWLGKYYAAAELFQWNIHPLPPLVRYTSLALSVLVAIVGGMLDRDPVRRSGVPYGAVFAMVGCTLFTTIAWNHYYVLLLIPMLLLIDAAHRSRAPLWGAMAAIIYLLNVYPISYGSILHHHRKLSIVRSEFYAGMLCMLALLLMHLLLKAGTLAHREEKLRA